MEYIRAFKVTFKSCNKVLIIIVVLDDVMQMAAMMQDDIVDLLAELQEVFLRKMVLEQVILKNANMLLRSVSVKE